MLSMGGTSLSMPSEFERLISVFPPGLIAFNTKGGMMDERQILSDLDGGILRSFESRCCFVYVLGSVNHSFTYVGSTINLGRRLDEHAGGSVRSTKHFRPLKLLAYVAVQTEASARKLERYFKTGSGRAILKRRILTDEVPLPRDVVGS
ncbi:MAG: GIY-YIG nuclease family protein [Bacteroidota bacterium]